MAEAKALALLSELKKSKEADPSVISGNYVVDQQQVASIFM